LEAPGDGADVVSGDGAAHNELLGHVGDMQRSSRAGHVLRLQRRTDVSHPTNAKSSGELEAYQGSIEASMKKADDLVVSVRYGHGGFLAPYEKESV
jgi:hypothetical protein